MVEPIEIIEDEDTVAFAGFYEIMEDLQKEQKPVKRTVSWEGVKWE